MSAVGSAPRRVRAAVVGVGGANFTSLMQACARIGIAAELTDDARAIARASHVLLPGVGAAGPAMQALRLCGLDRLLARLAQPLLGVCLGMQLLFERSAEGGVETLGLVPGTVERLAPAPTWPHMGWNTIDSVTPGHALFRDIAPGERFYYVHGYAAPPSEEVLATTTFGVPFAAAVATGNCFGVQFHPEKSAGAGRQLLRNFFAL